MWTWAEFLVPFLIGLVSGLLGGARMLNIQQREYLKVLDAQQRYCREVLASYAKSIDLLRRVHEHGSEQRGTAGVLGREDGRVQS